MAEQHHAIYCLMVSWLWTFLLIQSKIMLAFFSVHRMTLSIQFVIHYSPQMLVGTVSAQPIMQCPLRVSDLNLIFKATLHCPCNVCFHHMFLSNLDQPATMPLHGSQKPQRKACNVSRCPILSGEQIRENMFYFCFTREDYLLKFPGIDIFWHRWICQFSQDNFILYRELSTKNVRASLLPCWLRPKGSNTEADAEAYVP